MRQRFFLASLLSASLLSSVILTGCEDQETKTNTTRAATTVQTITIDTVRGSVTVPTMPKKIVVFDMGTFDTLHALGVKVAGVPANVMLKSLKDVSKEGEVVGTLFEPNLEALNELQPDLVFLSGRSAPKYESIKKLAPTIDMTPTGTDTISDGLKRLEMLGRLTGTEVRATEIGNELRTLLKETQNAAKNAGGALLLMSNGGKLSTFGADSRYGWIYNDLGFTDIVGAIKKAPHGQPVSFEFIKKTNPDWLFVIDRGAALGREGESAEHVLDNDLVHDTPAWKHGRIVYLSGESYVAPGGVNQIRTDLTRILQALKETAK